ncbi:MAG: class I SAM-dependent methyltransferase [Mariniblastus sp.]|nr:class I SAM-dependent methyltransferase [Mariniblastus sp.]
MSVVTEEVCENCNYQGLVEFVNKPGHYLLRCPECDLYQKGYLDSGSSVHYGRDTGTVYEQDYHAHYAKRIPGKKMTAMIRLGAAARYLPARPRILDVGCSVGATLRSAGELGWDASGVDISQAAVDFCRRDGLDAYKVDGFELPFDDDTFDLVTNWHVIEHLPDVMEAVAEWRRVLKPGGILMLETPASNFYKAKKMGLEHAKFWPPDHLYTFNRDNLSSMLDQAGYEMLPTRLIGGLTKLKPNMTLYAMAYRGYRETCRRFNLCKSFELTCRKPAA